MWTHKKVILKLDESETKFPIEIINSTDITDLEIIGGNFTFITHYIDQLKYLTKLSIVSTKVHDFPKEIFELPNLKYLSLKNNRIQNLPLLTKSTGIETLILNKNYIRNSDQFFEYLPELKVLDLGSNLLNQIPENIIKLKKLMRLNLEDNKLTTISSEFNSLQDLTHLNLDNNYFNKLEKARINLLFNIQIS